MNIVLLNGKKEVQFGHTVLNIDYHDIQERGIESVIEEVKTFQPSLFIEEEKNDGVSRYTELYQAFPGVRKAYWMIDAHITLAEHINYAKQFNFVFCAQSWFLPLVQGQVRAEVYFLPLCFPQPASWFDTHANDNTRVIPLSFIGWIRPGLHQDRMVYITSLLEYLKDKFFPTRELNYEKMIDILESSKVTFNCSLNNDLNFRVWEALGTGTPILTDIVTDIMRISTLPTRLITYSKKTMQEFLTMVEYAMSTNAPFYGMEETKLWVKGNHTLTNRYTEILEMIEKGVQHAY